jgi:formylglycine-generating enzyme required for sulfatase activity
MRTPIAFLFFLAALFTASANNLQISNVTLTGQDAVSNFTSVRFDVSWDNSWRDNSNWDAAWVFIKYSIDNGNTWTHAWLNTTPTNHTVPGSCTLSVGTTNISGTDRGMGVFLYRTSAGSGSTSWSSVQLRWEYGLQGIADDDVVLIKVFGVEMVYAPQKNFYAGDGTTSMIAGQFEDGNTGAPFLVSSEAALTLGGTTAGNLCNRNTAGQSTFDDFNYVTTKALSAVFPKGYNAFYCMKYEITQEQYKDFLNTLDRTQQANRATISATNRYVMSGGSTMTFRNGIRCPATLPATTPVTFYCDFDGDDVPNESTDGLNIAANFMTSADVLAYLDWSALRPVSELEYEKICRGSIYPQQNEMAWGDTVYVFTTGISSAGLPGESSVPAGSNCAMNNAYTAGPIRAGIYASASTTRQTAGAAFYGAMEMSGDLYELLVSLGNSAGRSFTGLHGDGVLTAAGAGNTTFWPASLGVRGGAWPYASYLGRISDRSLINGAIASRVGYASGRGCRTAP